MSAAVPPLRQEVRVGDADLNVLDWGGDGPAVLLAHAHTGQAWQLGPLAEALRAGGLRAVAYDRRGYGGSSRGADYQTSHQGEDARCVIDALDLSSVHVCGMAAGGGAVLDLAFLQPDRVRTLAMVCSFMGRPAGEWAGAGLPVPAIDEDPVALEVSPAFATRQPEAVRVWAEAVAAARASGAGEPMQARAEVPSQTDFANRLRALGDRLLVISGGKDRLFTPRMAAQASALWPEARHEVLASAAHIPSLECPDALAGLLIRHIAGSSS